jgi:hypothetical protein
MRRSGLARVALLLALGTIVASCAGEPATEDPAVSVEPAPRPLAPPEPAPAPEPTPPAVRPAPVQIRVTTIDVDASLVPVGILDGGVMEVPDDVRTIGWYDPRPDPVTGAGLGVIPGVQGTAVLAGHVDSRSQGRGALYKLRALQVGDVIEIDHADGRTTAWRVTEVVRYSKVTLPYDEVFTWEGPARLALITCGGEFDRTERSYTDNIIAYAEPLEGSAMSPA